jgi:hypothetical protein
MFCELLVLLSRQHVALKGSRCFVESWSIGDAVYFTFVTGLKVG